jgi:hypothetical protein
MRAAALLFALIATSALAQTPTQVASPDSSPSPGSAPTGDLSSDSVDIDPTGYGDMTLKDVPFVSMAEFQVRNCVSTSSSKDVLRALAMSSLGMQLSHGLITDVVVLRSSGNPEVDKRAVDCLRNHPPEWLKEIADDRKFVIPLDWNPTEIHVRRLRW